MPFADDGVQKDSSSSCRQEGECAPYVLKEDLMTESMNESIARNENVELADLILRDIAACLYDIARGDGVMRITNLPCDEGPWHRMHSLRDVLEKDGKHSSISVLVDELDKA